MPKLSISQDINTGKDFVYLSVLDIQPNGLLHVRKKRNMLVLFPVNRHSDEKKWTNTLYLLSSYFYSDMHLFNTRVGFQVIISGEKINVLSFLYMVIL